MSTWFVRRVEALSARNVQDIANSNDPASVDLFSNKNDFTAVLHEGDIAGVAQDDEQDDDDGNPDEIQESTDPNT